ncbi:hypothetical protein SCHPADRAFT_942395 [Schizopora paradoxa]|uniref:BTB domain-containing protein n=1 Tax=Schizopora paradoxa TaxID=27342 RepID=A0A0H2RNG8_9AGAM|nr:hypothetical protein SCHPADRAFT_942395 [Schizopora paradoxa]
MSHKRMRTDEEPTATIDENDGQTSSTPSSRKPHDRLWFPEGNVVLGTSSYLFRVHKSMLSMHSSVFKDMFESHVVDESKSLHSVDGESFDGLPLVNLLGDEDEDVVCLLRAIYERSFYSPDDDSVPVVVITGLLVLSTKYDMPDIRKDVIKQLSRQYPSKLDALDNLGGNAPIKHRFRHETWAILRAVLKTGVTSMLPTIYYACSGYGMSALFDSYPDFLDFQSLRTILEGRERLLNKLLQVLSTYVNASSDCLIQHGQGRSYVEAVMYDPELHEFIEDNTDITSLSGKKLLEEWPARVCKECKGDVMRVVDEERRSVWESLPYCYELPDWTTEHSNE